MEATVTTKLENVIHDARNTRMALDAFVPRREIDEKHRGIDDDFEDLKRRVTALESNQSRAVWAIITSWVGGLVVAVKAFK